MNGRGINRRVPPLVLYILVPVENLLVVSFQVLGQRLLDVLSSLSFDVACYSNGV